MLFKHNLTKLIFTICLTSQMILQQQIVETTDSEENDCDKPEDSANIVENDFGNLNLKC